LYDCSVISGLGLWFLYQVCGNDVTVSYEMCSNRFND